MHMILHLLRENILRQSRGQSMKMWSTSGRFVMTCHQIFYVTGSFPDIVLLAWQSVTLSKIGSHLRFDISYDFENLNFIFIWIKEKYGFLIWENCLLTTCGILDVPTSKLVSRNHFLQFYSLQCNLCMCFLMWNSYVVLSRICYHCMLFLKTSLYGRSLCRSIDNLH